MPYPPPPPPPEVGEFQGIGLLPAPELPTVVGHADEFLTNDGVIPEWEPVTTALPDQTGHGGQFLTTDGVSPSWSAASGGTSIFDIRTYGAISETTANIALATHDCSDAIEAAIAAWTQRTISGFANAGHPLGGVYIPPGYWFVSRPVVTPSGCVLYGESVNISILVAGGGTDASPSLVQGFGGSIIAPTGMNPTAAVNNGLGLPNYSAPLVGATGRSFNLDTLHEVPPNPFIIPPTICVDDCYPWSGWLMWACGALTVRFWVNVPIKPPAANRQRIMGSWSAEADEAFGICATTDGGGTNLQFDATLTTQITGKVKLQSGNMALGIHYIEITYDGADFSFYVDGVRQAHQAMTGRVVKKAWESVTIGERNGVIGGRDLSVIVGGGIDSIELSDIARHTGAGSYTPPTSKHVADSHTMWLANFDQGDPPGNTAVWYPWPFLIAQTRLCDGSFIDGFADPRTGPFTSAGLVAGMTKHYCRILGWGQNQMNGYGPPFVNFHDFGLSCSGNASGIVGFSSFMSSFDRILINEPSALGFFLTDPVSFYSKASFIYVNNCYGVGVAFACTQIDNINTIGCGVGFWMPYGYSTNVADQPAWNSFIPLIYGPSSAGLQFVHAIGHGEDEETPCEWQKCGAYIELGAPAIFESCIFDTALTHYSTHGKHTPCVMIKTLSQDLKMTGCNFYQPAPDAFAFEQPLENFGAITAGITLENCSFLNPDFKTNIEGLLSERKPRQISNQIGISTTDVQANNLAGAFTVLHGYTTGGATFLIPEPDANYTVEFACKRYDGSAPAAGSTSVISYVTRTDGFTATLGADPAGTCQLQFTYVIVRATVDPLLDIYLPVAGTQVNPLAGNIATQPWAVGVTLLPVPNPAIGYIDPPVQESIVGAGIPGAADSWEMYLVHGARLFLNWGAHSEEQFPFVDVEGKGKLHSLVSPGPHNICFGNGTNIYNEYIGGYLGGTLSAFFLDGGFYMWQFPPNTFSAGIQQTPINVAQRAGAVDPLTTCTLRNLKVYNNFGLALTIEQDAGPQVGDLEAAIFGDGIGLGLQATAPGWASQICDARFGTTFYHNTSCERSQVMQLISDDPSFVRFSYWSQWGARQPQLTSLCIQLGTTDILIAGAPAAPMLDIIDAVASGGAARCLVDPPTSNAQATIAIYTSHSEPYPPGSSASINGVPFSLVWNIDAATTWTDFANAINASAPTNTLVLAQHAINTGGLHYCLITGKALGFASNGIPVTSTGDVLVYPPGTTSGVTVGGANGILTIGPPGGPTVDFNFPFDTDVDTSINNVITLIGLDPGTISIVTPTLSTDPQNGNHVLLLTAVNAGVVGNGITVTSNNFGGLHVQNLSGTMLFGFDGAIQLGIPNIVICNVPPIGDDVRYTAGKETQRGIYNAGVAAFAAAHAVDGVVLGDLDSLLWDPGDHTKLLPAYLAAPNGYYLSDAGQTAVFTYLDPLLT